MAFAYTARAWQLNDLPSATAKYVFLCLADTANPAGYCWPKLATIAAKVQLSVRTVQRQLRLLEQAGVLCREARYHRQHTRANLSNGYWLNLDFDTTAAPTLRPNVPIKAAPAPAPLPESPPAPALAQLPVTLTPPACQLVTHPVTPCHPFEPVVESVENEATTAARAPAPAHVDAPACEAKPVIGTADVAPLSELMVPVAAPLAASMASIETTTTDIGTTTSVAQPTDTPDDPLANVAPDVLAAFNQVRQAKRQPALNRFVAKQLLEEATRAGLTLAQALTECVSRNWARFKADWLHAYTVPAHAAKAATSASASTANTHRASTQRPPELDPSTPEGQQRLQASFRAQQTQWNQLPRFTGKDAWAHSAIEKRRRGLQVTRHIFEAACQLLRVCPRTLQPL